MAIGDRCKARADALSIGNLFYNTGKPCKRGHLANRYVNSGDCVTCNNATAVLWRENNKEKDITNRKQYYKLNKEQFKSTFRRNKLKREYNISTEEYDTMLLEQGYRCSICKSESPGLNRKHFSVDHNHITGKVRGLLCHRCNTALGGFLDDIFILEEALTYLKRGNQID
jgi:hypothetical protein